MKNVEYLRKLLEHKDRIHFLLQNANQLKLLEQHFGKVSSSLVGLYTADMPDDKATTGLPALGKHNNNKYDIVYHAATVEPKGILYTLRLAQIMPERTFLIPVGNKAIIDNLCSKYKIDLSKCRNLVFENITWDNGLAAMVQQTSLVICPSLWSAPIEGALIKSLFYNGKVAVVDTKFSFAQELPEDAVLKLPADVAKAADIINNHLKDKAQRELFTINARTWVKEYLDKAEIMTERLFSALN